MNDDRDGRPRRFPAQWRPGSSVPGASATSREPLRPQRLLHAAAQDAARQVIPTGLGLDSAPVRQRMVQRLRQEGLRSETVLAAFSAVPRHLFVDTALAAQAYEDTSLPIGHGQTISKPSVVARMLQWAVDGATAAAQGHLGRVLEIGSGCGYQSALLALLGTRVVSIERLRPLHELARRNLDLLALPEVRLVHGDGRVGHAPNAPYDTLIAAAGGDDIPASWLDQLAVGGRLIAPTAQPGGGQALVIIDRTAAGFVRRVGEGVSFVPLKSGIG